MRDFKFMMLAAIFALSQHVLGQTGYKIVNSWNFENNIEGIYDAWKVYDDFDVFNLDVNGKEYISTDRINGVSTKVLKAIHDAGEYYDGFQLNAYFNESKTAYDEIYMSYNIKFGNEWNSTSGGKLPGIRGFPEVFIPPSDHEGFYYAPIFHPANRLIAYHYDRTRNNGAENPWAIGPTCEDLYFANGTWYNVTQRVVKNTFTNGVPNADGINEIWVNGRLIYQESCLKVLALESKGIDGFFLGNFYGGGTPDYLPLHQCDIYLDNVVIWIPTNDPTYGTRGLHNCSAILATPATITERALYCDHLITSPGTIKNAEYGKTYSPCTDEAYLIDAGPGNTITVSLGSYSIGNGDFLFFYDGNTTDAPLIKLIKGPSLGSNEVVKSTGRYLFIRFSTNTADELKGWTGTIGFTGIAPPEAPSALKVSDFSEKSISFTWQDNSTNEDGFVIVRSPVSDPDDVVELNTNANDTSFTDTEVTSGTTYAYSVKAVNTAGNSSFSNKKVAATMSIAETRRVRKGLIAYYNFAFNPDFVVYDVSEYNDPVNLRIPKPSSVLWEKNEELNILGNTALVSFIPAKKIVQAVKETNEITIECWIKPIEPNYSGKARILSLGNNDIDIGFALDQDFNLTNESKSLLFCTRLQTASTNESGYPELIQDHSSSSYINMYHVAYVRDRTGQETIYINGIKSAEGFRPSDLTSWKDNYYLRLGNESDMNHSWKGSFYVVAIYKNALSQEQIQKNFNAGPRDNLVNQGMKYEINFFPNPVDDLATFEILPQKPSLDIVARTTIRIVDTYGKILHQENIFNPYNQFSRFFNFQDLKEGIYFVQVISGDEKQSFKFIKK